MPGRPRTSPNAGGGGLPSVDGRPAGPGPIADEPPRPRGGSRAARGDPRRRLLHGPGRPVLHDAARRPRRGRDQGRAARRRRDAGLGAAVGGGRGRRDADGRLLPRDQPEQALDPARPEDRRRSRGAPSAPRAIRRPRRELPRRRDGRAGVRRRRARRAQPGPRAPRDLGVRHRWPRRGEAGLRLRDPGGRRADVDHGGDRRGRGTADQGRRGDQRRRHRAVRRGLDPGRPARPRRDAADGHPRAADRRVAPRVDARRPRQPGAERLRRAARRRSGWATPTPT